MASIIVLGAGRIGKAIALDLAQQHQILAVDIDTSALTSLKKAHKNIAIKKCDLVKETNIQQLLKPADLVVNAVPGFMGYRTLEKIIRSKKNVVDIAFFPENALELDGLAKKNHVTAVVDMGIAPGMSNLILGRHNQEIEVHSFSCMVGGLPMYPKPPFNYKASFSPVDVIEEYTRPARLIVDGKLVSKPALSDLETVRFDNIGTLEAFNTDGLRSLLYTMPNIPNMQEKTLRYPGHAQLISALQSAGFFSAQPYSSKRKSCRPLDMTVSLLTRQWLLEDQEREFTIMRIIITGVKNGKPIQFHYDLYDAYDSASQTTSMARTTGYACTAAVALLLDKRFCSEGVHPPEMIGRDKACFDAMLQYLQQRNVNFSCRII